MKTRKWIQKAKIKKGTLSRQLGIPVEKSIPMHILMKVRKTEVGRKIRVGSKSVPVTTLLKRRANLAINLKRIK